MKKLKHWDKETVLRCLGTVNAHEYQGCPAGTLRLTAADLASECPEAGYDVTLDYREAGWENLLWEEWLTRTGGERDEGVHFFESTEFPRTTTAHLDNVYAKSVK